MSRFEFGHATDVGVVRQVNQDRFFVDGSVFAVADGMGGHSGGEVASGLAVDTLSTRDRLTSLDDLVTLIHSANDSIVAAEYHQQRPVNFRCAIPVGIHQLDRLENDVPG